MPLAVTIAWAFGGVTQAAELNHAAEASRRPTMVQISQCMKKRMSIDRFITYNDAMKACEASIVARPPVASRSLLASATIRATADRGAFTESKQGRAIR
ncbi:MAG: hypothetical protein ABI579_05720 [Candidatus Sumerlaeota bacterium]